MKTIKQISKILLASIILIITVNSGFAQERKETIEKTFQIKTTGELTFSCYDTDLKVNTWQKDEVRLTGEIIIEGGDKDDQNKLIAVFKNPKIIQSTNSLSIETNMATNTIIIGPFRKTTLIDGKTIKIEKYKAQYTLWIPESISFNLKSKYNNIDIANLTGKLAFELHDADLTMLGFGKDSKFEMKYCSASIGKGGDAIMEIYDCELEALEMNNVEIASKYSEIDISSINTLDLNSYDDEIKVGKINSLTSEAKYSNFSINSDMANCFIKLYDSDINAKNIGQLVFTGKYASLVALNIKSAKVNDLYDSNIELAQVDEFSCNESKYDEITFASITKSISMPLTYSSELKIQNVVSSFESFTGTFKYGSVQMKLDPKLEFSLDFESTYSDVQFPKERFKINGFKMNNNDSKYSFEASTSENAKCNIKFMAYDTDFNLN